MAIKIRLAKTEDAEMLARVGWQSFEEAFGEHPKNHPDDMKLYRAEYFSRERVESDLREKDTVYLIAELENEIAGYAKIKFDSRENCIADGKTLELCRLYALDRFISKGVGKALMLEYLDTARRGDCEVCWLGVWEFNYRAQEFYRKFGFEKCGEHVFQLGSDPQIDWVMQKKV
ncbi:MAG: GNAT family N-acetyltransferase [Acidobacteriota bacterium]|nr:GNAT family N-acetyltransferase [Acidobacteriota bacterium]